MNFRAIILVAAVAVSLQACSAAKNLFGGNDDSVLPGERENVLPPEQQTARDPAVTGDAGNSGDAGSAGSLNLPPASDGTTTDCDPNDPNCVTPIDQEAETIGEPAAGEQ